MSAPDASLLSGAHDRMLHRAQVEDINHVIDQVSLGSGAHVLGVAQPCAVLQVLPDCQILMDNVILHKWPWGQGGVRVGVRVGPIGVGMGLLGVLESHLTHSMLTQTSWAVISPSRFREVGSRLGKGGVKVGLTWGQDRVKVGSEWVLLAVVASFRNVNCFLQYSDGLSWRALHVGSWTI